MFIKDPYNLLAEAASMDLENDTSMALTESQVNSVLESIDEVDEDIVYTAEMVSVIRVGNDYLTEMNSLYPYMQSNDITSVAEALNNVAKVNGLQEKAVGLLIESDAKVKNMVDEAAKKGTSAKKKALDKVKKATKLPAKLKKEGFPVKKKKSKTAKDEACAKEGCKTAVDEAEDPDAQHNRMMKKIEIEKKNGEGVNSDGYNARVSVIKHNRDAEKRSNGKYKNNHQSNGFDSNSDAIERHNRRHPEDKIVKGNRIKNESATEAGEIFDFDLL